MPFKLNPKSINNQFQAIWNQVISDPVDQLPQDKISYRKLATKGKNVILGNSQRTLEDHANILPQFDKLAHPNGICFRGVWDINSQNPYSGYFKQGSRALIVARASSALSNTKSGELRSFGFAGKLFPTMDPLLENSENTANFFLIDDLGGTRAKHYTDVVLTNEPDVSKTSVVFKSLLYVIKIARTFAKVDKNPGIRQVYEISELGEPENSTIVTPQWMKVQAQAGQTNNAIDFRDELTITDKPLIFDISVANKNKQDWQKIGTITLEESIVSNSCDHRLHFHHPKWKE